MLLFNIKTQCNMQRIIHKAIFGFILTILSAKILSAQTPVIYLYDDAGNRIFRTIELKSANADSSNKGNAVSAILKPEVFQDKLGDKKILIYPNPTRGQLKIDIEGYQEEVYSGLYLYTVSGGLLFSKSPANSSMEVDLSDFPVGTYILKIVLGNYKSDWKILKE